jgi:hypothetical protein
MNEKRILWEFLLGFVGAIVINFVLWQIILYVISAVGDSQWFFIVYILFYITEFVFSLVLARSKRHYIFIGVLVTLAFMLIPLLLSGACIVIMPNAR